MSFSSIILDIRLISPSHCVLHSCGLHPLETNDTPSAFVTVHAGKTIYPFNLFSIKILHTVQNTVRGQEQNPFLVDEKGVCVVHIVKLTPSLVSGLPWNFPVLLELQQV